MAEHMRVRPGNPYPGGFGQPSQAPGGRVAVHPGAVAVEQDRPASSCACRVVGGPADRRRQRDQDYFGGFATHAEHTVAVFFA
jgi:hypothetical protein